MRYADAHARDARRGSILVLTLVVLFTVAGFTLALLSLGVSSNVTSAVNAKRQMAVGLAEGAIEQGKQWLQTQWANQNGSLISAKAAPSVADLMEAGPWTNVTIGTYPARYGLLSIAPQLTPVPAPAAKVQLTPDGLGYYVDGNDGVRSFFYLYGLYGRAEYTAKEYEGDSKSVVAAMSKVVEARITPLFQYAVFYNSDLEILPGPNMTLTGRVHSNRDMYLGCGNTLTMDTDYVHAVGKMYRKRKDDGTPTTGTLLIKNLANMNDGDPTNDFKFKLPDGSTTSSKMFSKADMAALGISTPFGFDSTFGGWDYNSNGSLSDTRDWKPWGTQAMSFWGGTVQTSDMDVEKSEPPQQNLTLDPYAAQTGGDYDKVGGVYVKVAPGTGSYVKGWFAGKAGIYIENGMAYAPDGTNLMSALAVGTISTTTTYDARENKNVPQTVINMALLMSSLAVPTPAGPSGSVLAKLKSSWNGLLYATTIGASSSSLKGITLTNGSELPDNPLTGAKTGLTVVSDLPVYVKGDYNTKVGGVSSATNDPAYHKPAAVICDAVNLLSNGWTNTKTSGTSAAPAATATTFNFAMLTGLVESVAGTQYSGGLENLPRFHEDWTGKNCTISGSFVNLWKSKMAIGKWVYGGKVYQAPNRVWDFDPNYKDYNKLPPFTPLVVSMSEVCTQ